MADIDILVDSTQIKTAKQELAELSNSFNSAHKAASVFSQAFARAAAQSARDARYLRDVARANQEIINANLKVSGAYKSAEASANAFTEGLRKQEAQALKTARANQQAINKQLGVGGPNATSNGAGFGAIEAEALRLEAMYNKVAMSARVFEQAQGSLQRAMMLGVITSDQYQAELLQLTTAYQKVGQDAGRAQTFINRFGENAQASGRGLNQFGLYAQQVGYQVGDFFVQVQSGTNALVAFGQQATQLAGLIPGVLGAALGIGISLSTALGAAWMRTGADSEDAVDKISEAVDRLIQKTADATAKIIELKTGLSSDEQVIVAEIANLEAQRVILIEQLLQKSYELQTIQAETGQDYEYILEGYQDGIDLINQEIAAKQEILRVDKEREAELQAITDINKQMLAIELGHAKAAGDLLRAQKAVNEALSSGDAENFHKAINGALDAGIKFSQVDLNSIVAMAAKNGWSLAGSLRAAWAAAQAGPLVNANPNAGPGFENGGRSGSAMAPYIAPAPTLGDLIIRDTPTGGGSSGGGGGGGAAVKDLVAELQKQLDVEEELLGTSEAYQRVHDALGDQFKTTSPQIVQGLVDQINQVEKLKQLEEERRALVDHTKDAIGDGLLAMVDGTKSVEEAFKDMARSIIRELYDVLVVKRMVESISSSLGGGGGFLGALFGGARASGGSMMPGKAYLVGEHGPELVMPRHSGTVANANQTANMAGGSGGVTVQNNITVTGSDAAMVRAEVAKMIPQITNATKSAVLDARQRGGQFKAAFR